MHWSRDSLAVKLERDGVNIASLIVVAARGFTVALLSLSLFVLYIAVGRVCDLGQPRAAIGHAVHLKRTVAL